MRNTRSSLVLHPRFEVSLVPGHYREPLWVFCDAGTQAYLEACGEIIVPLFAVCEETRGMRRRSYLPRSQFGIAVSCAVAADDAGGDQ